MFPFALSAGPMSLVQSSRANSSVSSCTAPENDAVTSDMSSMHTGAESAQERRGEAAGTWQADGAVTSGENASDWSPESALREGGDREAYDSAAGIVIGLVTGDQQHRHDHSSSDAVRASSSTSSSGDSDGSCLPALTSLPSSSSTSSFSSFSSSVESAVASGGESGDAGRVPAMSVGVTLKEDFRWVEG